MKIISWNRRMAYRIKVELILKYCPDLVVVPECECLGELSLVKTIHVESES